MLKSFVLELSYYVVNISHILAIFVILIGMLKAMLIFIKESLIVRKETSEAIMESRLELGNAFSLGLGFLIGASILNSSLAPNWNDIGKLSAIIIIRTILNYFLTKDVKNMLDKRQKSEPITIIS